MSDGVLDPRAEAARLLRQRLEMGEVELFLDHMDRARALRVLRTSATRAALGERALEPGTAPRSGPVPRTVSAGSPPESPDAGGPPTSAPDSGGAVAARERAAGSPGGPVRPVEAGGPGQAPSIAATAPGGTAGPQRPDGASTAGGDLPVLPDDYEALRELALGCTRCGLSDTRTQVVFSDGVQDARLMVVGEAPGANEDETGLPFVGAAGQYLDLLLATVDLSREESVYICNVLKCRPPGNRNPEPDEIEACSPYLLKQIEVIRPEAILAVGSFAGKLLTGADKSTLGKLRGTVHSYQGVPLVVTYHPAALLRNANWTRAFWEDLQLLRDVLDGTA